MTQTPPPDDYGFDDDDWGDEGLTLSGDALLDSSPIKAITDLLANPQVMGKLETLIAESGKFLRMTDDLHDIAGYMNDMRMCIIAITVSIYIALLVYLISYCFQRNARSARPRQPRHDVEMGSQAPAELYDYQMNERATPQAATVITNAAHQARDVGVRYTGTASRPASYQRTKRSTVEDETRQQMMREDSRSSPMPDKDPLVAQSNYRPMMRQTTLMKELPPIADS